MTGDSRSVVIIADECGSRRTLASRTAILGSPSTTTEPSRSRTGPATHWWTTLAWECPVELQTQLLEDRPGGAFHIDGVGVGGRIAPRADRDLVGDRGDSSNPEHRHLRQRTLRVADDRTGPRHRTIDHSDPGVGRVHPRRPRSSAATASRVRIAGVSAVVMPDRIQSNPARSQGRKSRCRAGPREIGHGSDGAPENFSHPPGRSAVRLPAAATPRRDTRTLATCRGQELPAQADPPDTPEAEAQTPTMLPLPITVIPCSCTVRPRVTLPSSTPIVAPSVTVTFLSRMVLLMTVSLPIRTPGRIIDFSTRLPASIRTLCDTTDR